jgi:competence protein ComEC
LNPGSPDPALQAIRRPFDLSGAIKSASLVEIERGSWMSEGASALRASVRRSLDAFVGVRNPVSAAIVQAILIGDRSGLDPEVERRLQIAGTYHVVAISGGNIALLLAIVLGSLRLIWRSARGTSIVAMVAVCAYGWMAGGDPSVVRAVGAACLYLALGLAGHTASSIDVLLLVAAAMAALDPRSTVDVGAWLSFGATLGILLAARHVMRRLPGPLPPAGRVARDIRTAGVGLFACTVAAEWSLLPISARVFGRVGVAGLAVNFVAIPAMAAAQIAGLATCALAPVWTGGAMGAGAVAAGAAHLLVESASLVDYAPWTTWRVPPGWIAWTLIFYTATLGVLILHARAWRRALAAALAVSTLMILWAPETGLARPRAPWLRLTAIDVGQGDALLLQFPTGEAMTIDSGGGPGAFDVGDRVVTPAVWALGERRLTWLAVTHDDGDHIGGAVSLTTTFQPREVWEGVPVVVHPGWQRWRATARSTGAVWRPLQTGDRLEVGPVTIEVRNPPLPDWERRRVRNDDSLVLLVRYGDVDLLLAGDVGADVEAGLLAGVAPGALRVLKVAHHGSRTSTSPALLAAFRPQIALVSAGRGNVFGHPAPAVLARLTAAGARVYRTDQDGAVIVETDGGEVRVRTMTGRRWTWRLTKLPV